nr:FG-GAP repeat protein [Streptomyces sp. HNM0574]
MDGTEGEFVGDAEETRRASGSGRRRRVRAAVVAAGAAVVLVPAAWWGLGGDEAGLAAATGPAGTVPRADFDGDGREDLVVTSEFGDAVGVAYGAGPEGGEARRQAVGQEVTGTPEKKGDGVSFAGHTLARDLDGDGYTDLVADVDTYGADKGGDGARSGLLVVWGSAEGLRDGTGTYLRGVPREFSVDQPGDHTLVAGDFDGDRHQDLVVGAGSAKGLLRGPFTREGAPAGTAAVPKTEHRPEGMVSEGAVSDAYAADLNADGADDLVTVHEFEDDAMGGGKFSALTPGGPDGFGTPDATALPGIDHATTGDVDGDGSTDIVLRRHPEDSAPDSAVEGPVEVFHGGKDGPGKGGSRHTVLDQDTAGVPGRTRDGDDFGASLAAGDVDGDGAADVAVGAPGRDEGAGAVILLRGGRDGLTGERAELTSSPARSAEGFGAALRFLDTDDDGHADLAAGAPGEDGARGAAHLLRGARAGLTRAGAAHLTPDTFGIPAPAPARIGLGAHFAR